MVITNNDIHRSILTAKGAICLFSLLYDYYTIAVFALLLVLFIELFYNLGRGLVLRETIAIFYTFTCLLMPWIGYEFFNDQFLMARIWFKYMPIPSDTYFGYALPAISLFSFALTYPLSVKKPIDHNPLIHVQLDSIKKILTNKPKVGLYMLIIGGLFSGIATLLPVEIQFFATLCFFSSFAGLLYVYYGPPIRYKRLIMIFFLIFIFLNALNSGMFTIVAYMGITIFSFFFLKRRVSALKKVLFILIGIGFFIILQNAKIDYRKHVWKNDYEGNRALLFGDIFFSNLQETNSTFDRSNFFPIYSRTNQGFNVALVMRRFPSLYQFDQGKTLLVNIASVFVPRFLWPDKPEAGGKFNMQYYAGITLTNWSTNVGPLGEAYGSFGAIGGTIYMGLLGLLIRFFYKYTFIKSRKYPLLICWIPVLFFSITYSGEADTLQILNSFVKTIVFMWIINRLFPIVFSNKGYLSAPLRNNDSDIFDKALS